MVGAAVGLAIVLLLVLAHEAGHFLAARLFGLPVLSFSVGFGPTLWERRRGGTVYRLAAIPLGGLVRYVERDRSGERRLPALAGVLLAGPLTNVLIGLVLLTLTSPANGLAGAVADGFARSATLCVAILGELVRLLAGDAGQLGGPLAVGQLATLATQHGGVALLQLAAVVSLNLAVFNLAPIPILDGGQLAVLAMEAARGRPLHRRVQTWLAASGLAVLITLGVLAFANDVARLLV